jgi:hypothetical protein
MEEGLYEADVKTLEVSCINRDGNVKENDSTKATSRYPLSLLPGAHGKGAYSGQGVLVYSNNGELSALAQTKFDIESGSLNEWDGKQWKLIRRNQFVEVTGPGGIYGNSDPDDPIWTTGFDHKSLLVGVRDNGKWSFYRLPKASHSYDGAHGWNTEWPRIRDIGTKEDPFYLMTLHGMFWKFPGTFSSSESKGIRPLSAYLKVIGDFCLWNDMLVLGCDDAANKEFLNTRKAKGGIEGPGRSNSNLWFIKPGKTAELGPSASEGAVWLSEEIKEGESSEPFLFAGWENRSAWIRNEGKSPVKFLFEADNEGNNSWKALKEVTVEAGGSALVPFEIDQKGEWIRVSADKNTLATVHFWYTDKDSRETSPDSIFTGLSKVNEPISAAGLLWDLPGNSRKMGLLAGEASRNNFAESGYYELDSLMNLVRSEDAQTASRIREKMQIPQNVVTIDSASVLITDDKGRRWRLPKGSDMFTDLTEKKLLRICREVATERDLFNCSGTLYELPAENADGFAKIRPVASHNFRIYDYASYRGMLVMTGISDNKDVVNSHIIRSADGKAKVWAGVIDDLWKMGKPVGSGGPWYRTQVKKNIPSDPYLIAFYDTRTLYLSHNSAAKVKFRIEADPVGTGIWMAYREVTVEPGKTLEEKFPESFQARWIRLVPMSDCTVTSVFKYE